MARCEPVEQQNNAELCVRMTLAALNTVAGDTQPKKKLSLRLVKSVKNDLLLSREWKKEPNELPVHVCLN